MTCPDCGKRVPVLFNALENHRCLECLKKARIRTIKEQERARAMLGAQEVKNEGSM